MRKQKNEKKKMFVRNMTVFFAFVCLSVPFAVWQTNDIEVTDFTYSNSKIPAAFEDFKILQLSDIHNKSFGKNQLKLLKLIKEERPDIIVITGDLIDEHAKNLDSTIALLDGAIKIAPVYYVDGNHDVASKLYEPFKSAAKKLGVIILDNECAILTRDNDKIRLAGIADPKCFVNEAEYESTLSRLLEQQVGEFTILLSHRPEKIELYEKYGAYVCFTGHAHGGQIAIPFIGPVIAPNQGFFPEYTSGMYQSGDTTMFVSRGLGTTLVPIRLFAKPQIICVTLSAKM